MNKKLAFVYLLCLCFFIPSCRRTERYYPRRVVPTSAQKVDRTATFQRNRREASTSVQQNTVTKKTVTSGNRAVRSRTVEKQVRSKTTRPVSTSQSFQQADSLTQIA